MCKHTKKHCLNWCRLRLWALWDGNIHDRFDRDPITFECEGQVRDGLPTRVFLFIRILSPTNTVSALALKTLFQSFINDFFSFSGRFCHQTCPCWAVQQEYSAEICVMVVLCSDWPRKWHHMMCVIMFCQLEGQTITLESGYKSVWLKLVYENCSQWRFACDIHFVHERAHTHTHTHTQTIRSNSRLISDGILATNKRGLSALNVK